MKNVFKFPKALRKPLNALVRAGLTPVFVGGCVRDCLLGVLPKDFDVEVFGGSLQQVEDVLREFGEVDTFGASFGVLSFKMAGLDVAFDFSVPRRDRKVAAGHKGFMTEFDPTMTFKEAANRRDFTVNAVGWDFVKGDFVDPFNGRGDLKSKTLRVVNPVTFVEDPLRVLRGFQFVSRFGLTPTSEFFVLAQSMAHLQEELPKDRVREEWFKWAKGTHQLKALQVLSETGWLPSELSNLVGLPQDPRWHPEGGVFTHTGLVCEAAAKRLRKGLVHPNQRNELVFAALCHDLGKVSTTVVTENRYLGFVESVTSAGHAEAGVPLAESLMKKLGMPQELTKTVMVLTKEHMTVAETPKAVRRLSVRLGDVPLKLWAQLVVCDASGRACGEVVPEFVTKALELAETLKVTESPVKPLVTGDMLMQLGFVQGRKLGEVKALVFEAQLDGAFETAEEGLEFVRREFGV